MWNGKLAAGKLGIDVKLYATVEDATVHFHLLHAKDHERVQQHLLNPNTGELREGDQIHKGYEVQRGTFVLLSPAELAKLAPPASKSIELYAFVPAFAFAVGIVGAFITFMVTALSATILPMRRKEILQRSPVNWRIAGYPVITLVGALALIGLAAVQISVLSDPFSGVSLFPSTDAGNGPVIPFIMLLVNLAILATGFLVYGLARRVKKAQGIDLSLAFKEIPPE